MIVYAVASNVSVLLLARVEETSMANPDAPSTESVSELEEEDGLPGRSDADDIDLS